MGAISRRTAAEAGISAREAEVLDLVGQHLSNAEVGARLFISVRTVESHVSSLLRKLGVPDRRALARFAAELTRADETGEVPAALPSPLTPFVGRVRERAGLAEAVMAHRQVTAVGPGGVGKTRLALALAAEAAGEFADGVWFVDLVPITDPAMVGAAVAAALGIGEQQGRGLDESVVAALADRHALLVLDNCEHLRDGVAPFVERLLAGCPRLSVLATSRARLVVPFERAFAVPPLSLAEDGGASDAVALFLDRAAAVGWPVDPALRGAVAEICRKLDGLALAIELAAAAPAGARAGRSHRGALRPAAAAGRRTSRRRPAPLGAGDAGLEPRPAGGRRPGAAAADLGVRRAVHGRRGRGGGRVRATGAGRGRGRAGPPRRAEPAGGGDVPGWHPVPGAGDHPPVRDGAARQAGDLDATRSRHLRWCLASATHLGQEPTPTTGTGGPPFDAVADDLRAALVGRPASPTSAATRTSWPAAWRSWPSAATWPASPSSATSRRPPSPTTPPPPRRSAAPRPWQAAGRSATTCTASTAPRRTRRAVAGTPPAPPATWRRRPPASTAIPACSPGSRRQTRRRHSLLRPASWPGRIRRPRPRWRWPSAGVLADAFISELAEPEMTATETTAIAERAVELARRVGDPLAESAALDALSGAQLLAGDPVRHRGHVASSRRPALAGADDPVQRG